MINIGLHSVTLTLASLELFFVIIYINFLYKEKRKTYTYLFIEFIYILTTIFSILLAHDMKVYILATYQSYDLLYIKSFCTRTRITYNIDLSMFLVFYFFVKAFQIFLFFLTIDRKNTKETYEKLYPDIFEYV